MAFLHEQAYGSTLVTSRVELAEYEKLGSFHWFGVGRLLNLWMFIGAIVVAIILLVFFMRPEWVSKRDLLKITDAKERLDAKNANRDIILKFASAIVVLVALVVSAQAYQTSQDATEIAQDTLELNRDAQNIDRYNKSIEQLSSSNMTVRIGGIATLTDLLSHDRYHNSVRVRDVLAGFLRTNAVPPALPREIPMIEEPCRDRAPIEPPLDVQQALMALVERDSSGEDTPLDLRGVYLAGVQLPADSNLDGALLDGANLDYSQISYVNLRSSSIKHASFFQACLIEVKMNGARHAEYVNFERAVLSSADMTGGAGFRCVNMRHAIMSGVKIRIIRSSQLQGAYLSQADLRRGIFDRVDFTDARFSEAQLQSASFQFANGLTKVQLKSAFVDAETELPMRTEPWPTDCDEGV